MQASLTTNGQGSYALTINAPQQSERIPMHFIMVLDNSGSMEADDKMKNVKKCIKLLLNFLNDTDAISLITFHSSSRIHIKNMPTTEANKSYIASVIDKIEPQDMTNLSAALGNVRKLADISTKKTGVIILTDGIINQGIRTEAELLQIVTSIKTSYSGISINCIGYGTDHNASLLKDIAVTANGSYNIVNTIEDVATSFGDTVGGIMSCAAQNIEIALPAGAVVHGPFKPDEEGILHLGDIYSGTNKIILYNADPASPSAIVTAMTLPLLETVRFDLTAVVSTERSIDNELTLLRYNCTEILAAVAVITSADAALQGRIDKFRVAIMDSAYDDNILAKQLRNELNIIENLIHHPTVDTTAQIHQHISYFGLGRGFSSPIRSQYHDGNSEDPVHFQNEVQSNLSQAMRSYSQFS
jgi:hypothetical protein